MRVQSVDANLPQVICYTVKIAREASQTVMALTVGAIMEQIFVNALSILNIYW